MKCREEAWFLVHLLEWVVDYSAQVLSSRWQDLTVIITFVIIIITITIIYSMDQK